MPHLTRQPGDTIFMRGLWYRDRDDYLDTLIEYREDERAALEDDE